MEGVETEGWKNSMMIDGVEVCEERPQISSDWLLISQQPVERQSSAAFTQTHFLLRLLLLLHFPSIQGLHWSKISPILNS